MIQVVWVHLYTKLERLWKNFAVHLINFGVYGLDGVEEPLSDVYGDNLRMLSLDLNGVKLD
jgi:hypothetical protein